VEATARDNVKTIGCHTRQRTCYVHAMHLETQRNEQADLHLVLLPADGGTPDGLHDLAGVLGRIREQLKPGEAKHVPWRDRDYAVALTPGTAADARQVGLGVASVARAARARTVDLSGLPDGLAYEITLGVLLGAYRFTRYRTPETPELERVAAGLSDADAARLRAVVAGVNLARELVNTPFNDLTPLGLATTARQLSEQYRLYLDVWDRAECERRGLGLFLAVAQGSVDEPYFIRLTYRPESPRRVVALVGKGVMFDTGGYSLKPSQGMLGMKGDMGGAAAVIGAMRAVAELAPDVEVRAYVAACDNAVSADAMRPGDVYRGVSGKTVEVTNTDAEGRLTLADALAVADADGADVIIDLATLTGAKVTALGNDIAALFASDDALAAEVEDAARRAGEKVWRLPLEPSYLKTYRSGIADLKNSDMKPAGGSIKAATFLSEFVRRPWVHLDIAGNALREGEDERVGGGATGFGVMSLVEFVAPRA